MSKASMFLGRLACHLEELGWLNAKLEKLDREPVGISLDDARIRKPMSVAGISAVTAAVVAANGDIGRLPTGWAYTPG